MIYWIYNSLLSLSIVLFLPALPLLFLSGRRFRQGFFQRMGFYPRKICQSVRGTRPIWIHAVSVGEVLSAEHLAGQLRERFPGRKILLSTFTSTGNEIARESGAADIVIFLPLDHPWIVRRAINLFDPALMIFLETEIWPNFLRMAYRRGIPTVLLSGRLSPVAFRRYAFFRVLFSRVVQQFVAVGMQTEGDAERMSSLGLDPRRISVTGSLKHAFRGATDGKERDNGEVDLPSARKQGRQVLVVGSTHRGEEEILLDVFLFLKTGFPDLLLVLAPRHPQRFTEVERMLQKRNLRYEKKSQMNGREGSSADAIFLDTLGDLPAFYSVADVAFIGGSLVDAGGHNLMEPARFGKPVLFGPYMTNFADVAKEMKRKGGGVEVHGREDLIREISALLTDRGRAERMGRIAYSVVEGDRGVMDRSIALVSRYLYP